MKPISTTNKYIFIAVLLIIIIYAIPYLNSLTGEFVYDDIGLVANNLSIRSIKNIPKMFNAFGGGVYRPLRDASHAIDYFLWKLNPFGYHLTNILLHIVNSILLYFLILLILKSYTDKVQPLSPHYIALITSLIFASHPIHTEAVSWVSGRKELLMTFFYLIALISYIKNSKAVNTKRKIYYAIFILSFVLSLLAKEMALSLPFIIIVYNLIITNKYKHKLSYYLKHYLPYIIVFISFLIFFLVNEKGGIISQSYQKDSFYLTMLTMPKIFINYIRLHFFPFNLCVDYAYSVVTSLFEPAVIFSIIILIIIAIVTIKIYKSSKIAAFAMLWFFITLLPVSNIVPIDNIMAERYLYLPSIGFCLLIALIINQIAAHKPANMSYKSYNISLGFIIIFIITFSSITIIKRNNAWQTSFSLWADTVKINPQSTKAHNNLGLAYKDKKMMDKAINEFRLSVKLDFNNEEAHNNLGLAYQGQGMVDKAINEYKIAINIDPGFVKAYKNLSSALINQGKGEEAYNSLGNAFLMEKRLKLAENAYREALKINPEYVTALYNLGFCLSDQERYQEAVVYHKKAIALNKNDANPYFGLGIAYEKLGKPALALQNWEIFIQLSGENNPWSKNALEHIKALKK